MCIPNVAAPWRLTATARGSPWTTPRGHVRAYNWRHSCAITMHNPQLTLIERYHDNRERKIGIPVRDVSLSLSCQRSSPASATSTLAAATEQPRGERKLCSFLISCLRHIHYDLDLLAFDGLCWNTFFFSKGNVSGIILSRLYIVTADCRFAFALPARQNFCVNSVNSADSIEVNIYAFEFESIRDWEHSRRTEWIIKPWIELLLLLSYEFLPSINIFFQVQ